jgi:hypothetical protein
MPIEHAPLRALSTQEINNMPNTIERQIAMQLRMEELTDDNIPFAVVIEYPSSRERQRFTRDITQFFRDGNLILEIQRENRRKDFYKMLVIRSSKVRIEVLEESADE